MGVARDRQRMQIMHIYIIIIIKVNLGYFQNVFKIPLDHLVDSSYNLEKNTNKKIVQCWCHLMNNWNDLWSQLTHTNNLNALFNNGFWNPLCSIRNPGWSLEKTIKRVIFYCIPSILINKYMQYCLYINIGQNYSGDLREASESERLKLQKM